MGSTRALASGAPAFSPRFDERARGVAAVFRFGKVLDDPVKKALVLPAPGGAERGPAHLRIVVLKKTVEDLQIGEIGFPEDAGAEDSIVAGFRAAELADPHLRAPAGAFLRKVEKADEGAPLHLAVGMTEIGGNFSPRVPERGQGSQRDRLNASRRIAAHDPGDGVSELREGPFLFDAEQHVEPDVGRRMGEQLLKVERERGMVDPLEKIEGEDDLVRRARSRVSRVRG